MTLDKAIKHAEEVAEEQEKVAKEWHENQVRKCKLIRFAEMDYTYENECKECASEHRQLAEWLKDYKRLLEQEPCDDAISREDAIKAECEACDICGNMRYTKCQYFMQGCNEVKCLRDLPSVTQKPKDAEQKYGKWLHFAQSDDCSLCGWSTGKYISPSKYCPNCGCRMVEPQESEVKE